MTTKFSQRLQQAKDELGMSNRKIRDAARNGGHRISDYTVTQCLNGKHGMVTRQTVEALAFALRIPLDELAQLAGIAEHHGLLRLEGNLREDADTLTRSQAAAVEEVIRQLATANRKAGEERADSSAATSTEPDADSGATMSEAELYGLAAEEGHEGFGPSDPIEEQGV